MVQQGYSWKPTIGCIVSLPYVAALVPNGAPFSSQLLETLLDEYNTIRVVQGIKDESKLSRDVREKEEGAIAAATKAVSRHYRRTSVTVHPDRFGDTYQVEFDALKDAYEVLGDPLMRCSYVEALLGVMEKLGRDTPLIRDAHESWVRDNHATAQANLSQKAPTATRHMYLEGGLRSNIPRSVIIMKSNLKTRLVHLALNTMRPHQEFRNFCTAIVILAAEGGGDEYITLGELRGQQLEKAFILGDDSETLKVGVTLPDHGIWAVRWYASLEIDGVPRLTERSYSREIDMTDPEVRQLQAQKPALQRLARKQTGQLKSLINQLLAHQSSSSNREEIESRYWNLHQVISQARTTQQRLLAALHALRENEESCVEIPPLAAILGQAIIEKTKLDDIIAANQKKDTLKGFKQSIAAMIESGEAAEWMLSVDENELVNHGGEPNRLYQLLVEGKKANSILLDATALGNAAGRTDLFSKKQCEALVNRRNEVHELMVIETERMVKEAAEQEAAEKARREMERRGQLMARGTVVKLHGLKSKPELNGSIGVYMGLGQGDRYVVRLYGVGKEVSLLATNFEKIDESSFKAFEEPVVSECDSTAQPVKMDQIPYQSPSCWACAKCSFQHDGPLAATTQCDMCDTPRGPLTGSFAAARSMTPTPSVPGPSQRREVPASAPKSKAKATKTIVWIRKKDVSVFIGPKGKHVREMLATSGARKISADQTAASRDGMCPIHIEGNPGSVQKAVAMVEKFSQDASVKKTTSLPSKLPNAPTPVPTTNKLNLTPSATTNMIVAPTTKSNLRPSATTNTIPATTTNKRNLTPSATTNTSPATTTNKSHLTPSATTNATAAQATKSHLRPSVETTNTTTAPRSSPGEYTAHNRLLVFLHEHQSCLKCTPDSFHKWLQSEDISSLVELAEAVSDDDFVRSEMQEHGLKVSLCFILKIC
jgi:hypothetical protein